jgi:hypothetical protein
MHEEIKSRLNLGNACYHLIQSLVFQPAPKECRLKYKKPVILPVVLYGCETWSLILREEYRLRVFENRVLKRIFRPKWIKQQENGGSCTMSFIICIIAKYH